MAKMNSKNRIIISKDTREVCDVDFYKEVRIFLYNKNGSDYIFLSNDKNVNLPCFGIAHFDSKFRFYVPAELRKHLSITSETKFLVYSLNEHLLLRML